MDAGEIDLLPVEPLAHILLGALNETAMVIARGEDRQSARSEVGAVVDRLLKGLKAAKSTQRKKARLPSRPTR
jgi:hypothetical protein